MDNLYQKSATLSDDTFKKLEKAFINAWSIETVNPDVKNTWSEENKAYGQCTPTALVVYDLFGGKLIYDKENYHIWNELPDGSQQDFSRTQFTQPTNLTIYKYKTKDEILQSEHGQKSNMEVRYELLKKKVLEEFQPTYRLWGSAPYSVVTIHGGPGMAGDIAPLAIELSKKRGVIEPLQTRNTIDGLISELKNVLDEHATTPITLIGHSWGAMLSFIFAAKHPEYVKKLILIDSAEFEEKYAAGIMHTRMSRLNSEEQKKLQTLIDKVSDDSVSDKDDLFRQMGPFIHQTDSYQEIPHDNPHLTFSYDLYKSIWPEAEKLRGSGELIALGKNISALVTVIHGNYDPHPFDGINASLSNALTDVHFVLLDKCGHYPWLEEHARKRFYEILEEELERE